MLGDVMTSFTANCVMGIEPNEDVITKYLQTSLMLVTALTPHIGYDKAARIAHHAHKNRQTLKQAALDLGFVSEQEFDEIVDPSKMV